LFPKIPQNHFTDGIQNYSENFHVPKLTNKAEELKMKSIIILTIVIMVAFFASPTIGQDTGQDPPAFYKNTYPEHALKEAVEAKKALMGKEAKLDAKTRELIAIAVAAQIPCTYCVYVHNKNALSEGASEAEIREAVATAAHVRHWSTVLNGMGYDLEAFKVEVDQVHSSK
jgi:AhpD family alkylhydroperoxidase